MDAYKIGVAVGVFIGIILVCIFIRYVRNDGSAKANYDERQELVRGRGYKLGFFSLLISKGAIIFAREMGYELPLETNMESFIVICIGIAVFVTYAIWNEGYFAINENPKKLLTIFLIAIGINVIATLNSFNSDLIIKEGKLTFSAANLVCIILFVVIFLVLLIKTIVDKIDRE